MTDQEQPLPSSHASARSARIERSVENVGYERLEDQPPRVFQSNLRSEYSKEFMRTLRLKMKKTAMGRLVHF